MKLLYRRILYLSFIGFFLIITPIVIMYATGYRYNFTKGQIQKIGILYIDSQPKKADIFINDKYKAKTPKRFGALLPDIYKVKVQKEGYYTWEKELEVISYLTTFAKDIVLFKKSLPINIIEGEINIFASSFDQEKIIYSIVKENSEELRLLNLNNNDDFLIKQFNKKTYNQLKLVSWSPNNKKALLTEVIGDFNKYLILDIETLKVKELFDITRLNFSQVEWDNFSDNYLYGLRKAVLHKIDLVNNTTRSILSDNIKDFEVKGGDIYYISKIGIESFLNLSIIENDKVSESKKIKLPSPSQYTLSPSTRDYLVLLDRMNNDLFIINSQAFTDQDTSDNIILQDNAKKVIWSENEKIILCYNDFEIWTFNFETKRKNLITRYGSIINQVKWYPGNKYIIYQANNEIRVIEGIESEIKEDLQLVEFFDINNFNIDDKGENLYFKATVGNQQGIYKLEIQ